MNREQELTLIERCLQMHAEDATTLQSGAASSPVQRYTCPQRFQQEMARIHRLMPVPWVHVSELEACHSFRRVATSIGDVLFTRDGEGVAHAFHNVCRHRGSRLVEDSAGCSPRLTCPYHAWSYASDGSLAAVPAEQRCFPALDRGERGLSEIATVEAHGFIWLCPEASDKADAEESLARHLGEMAADLDWLQMDRLRVHLSHTRVWHANWKLVSEGGLETYHFRTAHRDTIGPYFLNNISIQDSLGIHSRMIMPSKKIDGQAGLPEEQRRLRDFSHILFGVAPQSSFLAQEGHVDWIRMTPLSVDTTEIAITSLVPVPEQGMSDKARQHWQTNFDITLTTLDEDFIIGEGIQSGLTSGANRELLFGANEGLLAAFNDWVEASLAQ